MGSIRMKSSQILTISKKSFEIIDNQAAEALKAVKFISDFRIDEILEEISKLYPKIYPNISIFIIEQENFQFSAKNIRNQDIAYLKEYISRFHSNSFKTMLHLYSKDEKMSKFYYRINLVPFFEISCDHFVALIDDQLLNLMVDQGRWSKNSERVKVCEEFFKIIFKERNFYKITEQVALDEDLDDEKEIPVENPHEWVFESLAALTTCNLSHLGERQLIENSDSNLKNSSFRKSNTDSKICHSKNVKIEELSLEEMLENVKNMKIILISDKPKSGKSWTLKNLSNQLREKCQEKYTIYIDLEKLTQKFEAEDNQLDFATFIANIITDIRNNFEAEVFKKHYKNGKVNIFIDNIQKSSSNSELLTKFLQSFQQNGGNQLWIAATTDLEVNLKEKLKLDVVYKLDELIKKPRCELIELCHELLENEVKNNKSLEFHRILWQNIRGYFDFSDIYQMIQHPVQHKENSDQPLDLSSHLRDSNNQQSQNKSEILLTSIEHNTKEVAELIWNQIKAVLIVNGQNETEDYLNQVRNGGKSIIQVLMESKDPAKLQYFWNEFRNLFESKDKFKELFNVKISEYPLHIAANCSNLEFHMTLWTLLLETFENLEELNNLILQTNSSNNNFIHCLIDSDNPQVIEFTFIKIKDNFSIYQYQEIIQSKASNGRNLLQKAASRSKNVTTFQILWKIFQDIYRVDQFLDIFKEVDDSSCNIFQIAACFASRRVFQFMIDDLEKFVSKNGIENFLTTLGISRKNLMQLALTQNKSLSFHQYLWKIMKKYFNSDQILEMIKHANVNGKNILFHAFEYSTKEIVELTRNEISKIFMKVDPSELQNYLKSTNNDGENILHVLVNINDTQRLKDLWPILEKFCRFVANLQLFKELFFQKTILRQDNVLHAAAKQDSIGFHDVFWKLLLKSFKNREELMDLMFQINKFEDNFITFLVLCDNPDVIEFTFQKINQNFSYNHYQAILHQQEYGGRNLLQYAACTSKNIKTHQVLWKIYQNSCKISKEFLEIVKEVDGNNNNVIHYAACFATKEVFDLMINELLTNEIKKILAESGESNRNLLQLAARHNESLEFHQNLWEIIEEFFNESEIMDMILHTDENGNNLMINVVESNTKEIVEFTWNEVQKSLENENTQPQTKEFKGTNLMKASLKNECNPDVHEYCKTILQDYEKAFEKSKDLSTNVTHYRKRYLINSHLDSNKRPKI